MKRNALQTEKESSRRQAQCIEKSLRGVFLPILKSRKNFNPVFEAERRQREGEYRDEATQTGMEKFGDKRDKSYFILILAFTKITEKARKIR